MIEQLLKLNTLEDVHAIAGIDVDEIFKEFLSLDEIPNLNHKSPSSNELIYTLGQTDNTSVNLVCLIGEDQTRKLHLNGFIKILRGSAYLKSDQFNASKKIFSWLESGQSHTDDELELKENQSIEIICQNNRLSEIKSYSDYLCYLEFNQKDSTKYNYIEGFRFEDFDIPDMARKRLKLLANLYSSDKHNHTNNITELKKLLTEITPQEAFAAYFLAPVTAADSQMNEDLTQYMSETYGEAYFNEFKTQFEAMPKRV
jgi:hypothetical protein